MGSLSCVNFTFVPQIVSIEWTPCWSCFSNWTFHTIFYTYWCYLSRSKGGSFTHIYILFKYLNFGDTITIRNINYSQVWFTFIIIDFATKCSNYKNAKSENFCSNNVFYIWKQGLKELDNVFKKFTCHLPDVKNFKKMQIICDHSRHFYRN